MSTSVTYPSGSIDTLEPFAVFIAPAHTEAQVEVSGPQGVLISRACNTRGNRIWCGRLPAAARLNVRVRVGSEGRWEPWSEPREFSTPADPFISITSPPNAGRARGPLVTVQWKIETSSETSALSMYVDGNRRDLSADEIKAARAEVELETGLHEVRLVCDAGASASETRSCFYVWRPQQRREKIVQLDLTPITAWDVAGDPELAHRMYDILHAAACLQGIVNRDRPRLMLRLLDSDDFWLGYLSEQGGWLENAEIERIDAASDPEKALADTVEQFKSLIKGLVVWDEAVWATSNVATTIAGIEDVLPVRSSGGEMSKLGDRLVKQGLQVREDLRGCFPLAEGSSGSAKCDAYLWAAQRYIKSGRANPRVLGYWLDSFWLEHPGRMPWWECCLSNHDWVVANRGFLFDLSNWGDEAPQDDLSQPVGTDLETFRKVMLAAYEASGGEMIHVSGFTPWGFKYTDHAEPKGSHQPVATEWEVVRVLSAYNAWLDADAHGVSAMANASLWRHMPRPDRYVQNAPPSPQALQKLGYIDPDGKLAPLGFTLFYIGDFDSAAWLYRQLPGLYADAERGEVPMGWAINPNLSLRNPAALDLAYTRASGLDYFTAGDSGAGYVNPTMMIGKRPISGLPDGSDEWVRHCLDYYRRFNLRITGFLINGHAGKLTDESLAMTARFSPDGSASQRHWYDGDGHLAHGMPFAWMCHDLDPNVEASAACMSGFRKQGLQFLNFRTILLGPSYIRKLAAEFARIRPDAPVTVLGPWEFYYLLRHHLGGSNSRRATFTFDTLADAKPGGSFQVGVRNDGWDTWKAGDVALEYAFGPEGEWSKRALQALASDVAPGEGIVVEVRVPDGADVRSGFRCDLRGPDGAFREYGGIAWEAAVRISDIWDVWDI